MPVNLMCSCVFAGVQLVQTLPGRPLPDPGLQHACLLVRLGCARAIVRKGGVFYLLNLRYGLLLFPGFGDGSKELDYNTVNTYVKGAFEKMGFTNSRKVRRSGSALRVLF